jgi:hypothetical protein
VSKARKESSFTRPNSAKVMPSQSPSPWRCVDLGLEHESFGVDQQMALSAFDLLSSIVAALFSAYPSSLDRLAIHYACAGLGVPLQANPHSLAQSAACILSQVPSRRNSLK